MSNQKGFTLIEMICVLLIMGVLAATATMKFIDLAPNAERKIIGAVASEMSSQEHMAWIDCKLQEDCVDYVRPDFLDLRGMSFNNTNNTITFDGGGTHQLYEWYYDNSAVRWDTVEQIITPVPDPDPICKVKTCGKKKHWDADTCQCVKN